MFRFLFLFRWRWCCCCYISNLLFWMRLFIVRTTCAIKIEHHFNCYIGSLFILLLFFVFALLFSLVRNVLYGLNSLFVVLACMHSHFGCVIWDWFVRMRRQEIDIDGDQLTKIHTIATNATTITKQRVFNYHLTSYSVDIRIKSTAKKYGLVQWKICHWSIIIIMITTTL